MGWRFDAKSRTDHCHGQAFIALASPSITEAQSTADQPDDIGAVQATDACSGAAPDVPQTAEQIVPSRPSLGQFVPTSTGSDEALRKIIVKSENYKDVTRLMPSAIDIAQLPRIGQGEDLVVLPRHV